MLKVKASSKNKSKVKFKKAKKSTSVAALVEGDLIDIVAPGSSTDLAIIEKACTILQSWGYRTRVAADLFEPELFLSNSDAYRFNSLKKAFLAKDSRAIWCVRGGYGSIRLLPYLNKLKKPRHQKILIGFSDITSLQIFLTQKWNWSSIHGPLLDRLGLGSISLKDTSTLRTLLNGSKKEIEFHNLKPLNAKAQKIKLIQGRLTGGNLMVATSTLGTENQINGNNKILFFEELSERSYRIDRCLQQMLQAGVFKKTQAVIFGEFIKCLEPDGSDMSLITITEFFKALKVPAFHGVQLGHGINQRPILFNTNAEISPMAIDHSQFKVLISSPYEVFEPRK